MSFGIETKNPILDQLHQLQELHFNTDCLDYFDFPFSALSFGFFIKVQQAFNRE